MKKRAFVSLLLAVACTTGLLAGCGSKDTSDDSSSNNAATDETQGEAEYGDTINYGINVDTSTLDPQAENDNNSEQVLRQMYETLLMASDEGPQPLLAESWSCADDKVTWTFNLRHGVKFHDGSEMTADDVIATFERAKEYQLGRTATGFSAISSFEKVDDYTVNIITSEPYGALSAVMTDPVFSIMDDATIEKYGLDIATELEAENGTGPYKLVSWDFNNELCMESFPDYWGGEAPTKYLNFKTIPDSSARLIALQTGEVDIIEKFTQEDLDTLRATEGIVAETHNNNGFRIFQFGCNDPIISNTKVRQALVYAVDKQAVLDALYGDTAHQATDVVGEGVFGYANLGIIEQDQDKARELLAEAGYPDGFDTKIVTTPRYEKGVEMAEIVKAQLAEVGVNAEIEVLEWNTFLPYVDGITPEEFNWPIFIMGLGSMTGDADSALRGLFTTSTTGTNIRNYGFYSNAEVDELIYAAAAETDQAKRQEYYARAGEILYREDPAGIWMWGMNYTTARTEKLQNVTVHTIGEQSFEHATILK